MTAGRCRPCALCRRPARLGRACDECRERVRREPHRATPGSTRKAGPLVSVEPLREAFERSGDDARDVAARVGWRAGRVREVLASDRAREQTVLALAVGLHVAPVEVGL